MRLLCPDCAHRLVQLDEEPLRELFASCAGPRASTHMTPKAFWKGMRLIVLDGTLDSTLDSQSNGESFRYSSDHPVSRSPYPLVRAVLLIECGTHLICDADFTSCRTGEVRTTERLLRRSMQADMLVLWFCEVAVVCGLGDPRLIFGICPEQFELE